MTTVISLYDDHHTNKIFAISLNDEGIHDCQKWHFTINLFLFIHDF
jgi:hypothetical protein